MIEYGADVSNFTSPLTAEQLAFAEANWSFVVIGLQDAGRARDFQRQFANLKRMYYIERPTRDLTIPEPGAMVWLDLEPGCLVNVGEVQQAIEACEAKGLPYGIYGNETSIVPVIGNATGLSHLPYWWANYGTPDLSRFKPHNGWTKPTIMQYSSAGVAGINCDLNIMEVPDMAAFNLWPDGSQRIEGDGERIIIYNKNLPVLIIGGDTPGQISKLFPGDKRYNLAHQPAIDGHNAPVVFSDVLTD